MKMTVLPYQTLADISTQTTGGVEAVLAIALANGISPTAELDAGTVLTIPANLPGDEDIANYFKGRKIEVATKKAPSNSPEGGGLAPVVIGTSPLLGQRGLPAGGGVIALEGQTLVDIILQETGGTEALTAFALANEKSATYQPEPGERLKLPKPLAASPKGRSKKNTRVLDYYTANGVKPVTRIPAIFDIFWAYKRRVLLAGGFFAVNFDYYVATYGDSLFYLGTPAQQSGVLYSERRNIDFSRASQSTQLCENGIETVPKDTPTIDFDYLSQSWKGLYIAPEVTNYYPNSGFNEPDWDYGHHDPTIVDKDWGFTNIYNKAIRSSHISVQTIVPEDGNYVLSFFARRIDGEEFYFNYHQNIWIANSRFTPTNKNIKKVCGNTSFFYTSPRFFEQGEIIGLTIRMINCEFVGLQINKGDFPYRHVPTHGQMRTVLKDEVDPIAVPDGTTKIIEDYNDGREVVQPAPEEYQLPRERHIKSISML